MELVILARLKWDLAAVTPYSFLEHLLRMMADTEAEAEDRVPERVKKIAETTIILCATEYRYNTTVKCALYLPTLAQYVTRPSLCVAATSVTSRYI